MHLACRAWGYGTEGLQTTSKGSDHPLQWHVSGAEGWRNVVCQWLLGGLSAHTAACGGHVEVEGKEWSNEAGA
eukprot:907423-Rhodomonas_salina.1